MGFFRNVTRAVSRVTYGELAGGALLLGQPELAAAFAFGGALNRGMGGNDSIAIIAQGAGRATPEGPGGGPPPTVPPPVGTTYSGSPANPGGVPVSGIYQFGSGVRQQTPATRFMLAKLAGSRGGKRSAKRRKKKAKAAARRPRARKAKRPARLVKGSLAAKRYMASIRKKRK